MFWFPLHLGYLYIALLSFWLAFQRSQFDNMALMDWPVFLLQSV